jgi:hypothetical protein
MEKWGKMVNKGLVFDITLKRSASWGFCDMANRVFCEPRTHFQEFFPVKNLTKASFVKSKPNAGLPFAGLGHLP